MNAVINQFRRIYSDDGSGDKDFSGQEARLRAAQHNLALATRELVRSSNRLNDVLLANGFIPSKNNIN